MDDIGVFLSRIRNLLADYSTVSEEEKYLDLAGIQNVDSTEELLNNALPHDSLITFQEIIMAEAARCNLDKIKFSINELLKHLLYAINQENEHHLAERYLYRLRMIFKRCLMSDFPFPEEVWNYICDCLRSAGTYLVENGFYTASREIIDSLAQMGRIASLKGMPTANTQSSLRMLENKSLEKNQKQLASIAKNARFNLET